jgi:NADH:ubiquinone oxidoreductase subunit 5 (subunit L)/multisubunit Na+/H+ antiporter MnhA subunit
VAVGILFGIFAVVAELPLVVLVVLSTIAGALAITAGLMLVFNALDTEDFTTDTIVDLIDDDWFWWVIAFGLAIAGLIAQMKLITRMRWTVRQAWDNSWRPGPPPAIT